MRKLLDLRAEDCLIKTTLCGHGIFCDHRFLDYAVGRVSEDAVRRCIDNHITEEDLRQAIRDVVAAWRQGKDIDRVFDVLTQTTPVLSTDEARVRLLATVVVCADRAPVHARRKNAPHIASDFHWSALRYLHAADYLDTGSARAVMQRFAQLGSRARHARNHELFEQAERYWEANIDPGLSNEKAAELLTKVVPLSHVTLRRHVAEFKRKKLHHPKKE
jgi:hypothetical protein